MNDAFSANFIKVAGIKDWFARKGSEAISSLIKNPQVQSSIHKTVSRSATTAGKSLQSQAESLLKSPGFRKAFREVVEENSEAVAKKFRTQAQAILDQAPDTMLDALQSDRGQDILNDLKQKLTLGIKRGVQKGTKSSVPLILGSTGALAGMGLIGGTMGYSQQLKDEIAAAEAGQPLDPESIVQRFPIATGAVSLGAIPYLSRLMQDIERRRTK